MDTTWTYLFTKGSKTLWVLLNKKFQLFTEEDQLVATRAKLAKLQEVAKLSEMKAVEVKKEVEVAVFNIDFIRRRDHAEEIFWRFPHQMTDYLMNT